MVAACPVTFIQRTPPVRSTMTTVPPPPQGFHRGTVKWFNAAAGYGFLKRQDNGEELFVHHSAVAVPPSWGPRPSLLQGEVVDFRVHQSSKGPEAKEVTGPGGAAVHGNARAGRRPSARGLGSGTRRCPSERDTIIAMCIATAKAFSGDDRATLLVLLPQIFEENGLPRLAIPKRFACNVQPAPRQERNALHLQPPQLRNKPRKRLQLSAPINRATASTSTTVVTSAVVAPTPDTKPTQLTATPPPCDPETDPRSIASPTPTEEDDEPPPAEEDEEPPAPPEAELPSDSPAVAASPAVTRSRKTKQQSVAEWVTSTIPPSKHRDVYADLSDFNLNKKLNNYTGTSASLYELYEELREAYMDSTISPDRRERIKYLYSQNTEFSGDFVNFMALRHHHIQTAIEDIT